MADRLHFSRLKLMSMSPAHYRAGSDRSTRAMGLGTVVHSLCLGGDAIVFDGERKGSSWAAFKALVAGEPFAIFDGARRGKAWESARDEAARLGQVVVTSEDLDRAIGPRAKQAARIEAGRYTLPIVTVKEYEQARRCADAVMSHELAGPLLTGQTEVPLEWRYLGRDCAGQIDVIGSSFLTDLKTSACSEPSWFTRQTFKMAYHAQLAWYAEGARQNGYDPRELHLVAVEPRKPYAVTCFRLTDRAIEDGERLLRYWMERLAVCEQADVWPAYSGAMVDLDVAEDVELIWPGDEEDAEAA